MMDKANRRLVEWVTSVIGPVAVVQSLPNRIESGEGVGAYLFDMVPTPAAREVRRAQPLKITLRYLITAWSDTAGQAQAWLGQLMFAAIEAADFEVETEALPPALWVAFQVPPRPCLRIRVSVQKERPERRVPLVRTEMEVKNSPLRSFSGWVLGPKGNALMGVRVELPSLRLATWTNRQGRFRFAAVPADPILKEVSVQAKGRRVLRPIPTLSGPEEAMIIELDESEV